MVTAASPDDVQAISVLMALAYTKAEARAALKGLDSNLELDERIWQALQHLNKECERRGWV